MNNQPKTKYPKTLLKIALFLIPFYFLVVGIWPIVWGTYYSPTKPPGNPGVILKSPNPGQKTIFRAVVIGDSTALGQGTDSVKKSFGYQYLESKESLKNQNWSFENRAISGVKIAEVLEKQLDFEPADLVLVSIGANDITGGTNKSEFRTSVESLAQKLKTRAKQVIWLNIPDFITSPILLPPLNNILSQRANDLNQILEAIVPAANYQLIDVYNGGREPFAQDPDRYFGADKYHPSVHGYNIWVGVIQKKVD